LLGWVCGGQRGWGCSHALGPHSHLLPISPKAQPRRGLSPRHSSPALVPVRVQIIPSIWTIPGVLLTRGVRRFPARLLTESANVKSTAEKNKREEDNRKRGTQTTAGHKLKRHSCAGATQRRSRVSTIKRRFPRPRKSTRPW
jgi:hypothetical protein